MKKVAIVGAGLAGFSVARKLRELGFSNSISLYGDEGMIPYDRPPLSKAYLLGETGRENLELRADSFFQQNEIGLFAQKKVQRIDAESKKLYFDGGDEQYDALVFATGATVRQLPESVTGGLQGVYGLRDLRDADNIAKAFENAKNVLVVGGGYIGLELAAAAIKKDLNVTLVEAAPRILQRVAAEPTSDYFRQLHQSKGVDIREDVGLQRLVSDGQLSGEQVGNGKVSGAELSDGSTVEADCVLVGVGIVPNTTLAEDAGIEINGGIQTDEHCRTSDPSIWAAGDCASFPNNGGWLRLESVGNAIDMGECVAENLMGGERIYVAKPWFWSDQYEARLQIAGLGTGHDQIVMRPGEKEGAISHWYYGAGKLLAVDAVNDSKAYMVGRRLIEAGRTPDPALVVDVETKLTALLKN